MDHWSLAEASTRSNRCKSRGVESWIKSSSDLTITSLDHDPVHIWDFLQMLVILILIVILVWHSLSMILGAPIEVAIILRWWCCVYHLDFVISCHTYGQISILYFDIPITRPLKRRGTSSTSHWNCALTSCWQSSLSISSLTLWSIYPCFVRIVVIKALINFSHQGLKSNFTFFCVIDIMKRPN